MRRRRSTCAELAAAGALIATLAHAAPASAQACCAGATSLTPARLALHEDALVGLGVRAADVFGAFDASRRFAAAPKGADEVDLEQDLVGAVRLLGRAQASLTVPFVETWRRVPGRGEFGGGIGDLAVGARYDFTEAGESLRIPGIAILAGARFPTGRPPESAELPLATDATGAGMVQLSGGAAIEQMFGHLLVNVTGVVTWRAPRHTHGLRVHDDVELGVSGAFGYVFDSGAAIALTLGYTAEGSGTIDGAPVANGGRAVTRAGLAGGVPLSDTLRLQGQAHLDAPIPELGKAQPTAVGLAAFLLRTF